MPLTGKELAKIAISKGWKEVRVKGSHHQFKKDGSYWVEFPGFGGGTEGSDVEEAMKNAREMLENSLAAYLDEGLTLPKIIDMNELSVSDGFISLIQADPSP